MSVWGMAGVDGPALPTGNSRPQPSQYFLAGEFWWRQDGQSLTTGPPHLGQAGWPPAGEPHLEQMTLAP